MLTATDAVLFLEANNIVPGTKRILTKLEFYALIFKAKEQSSLLSKFIEEAFWYSPYTDKFCFHCDTWDELANYYYSFAAGHAKKQSN